MANSIDERIPTEDNNGNTMHETNAQSLGKSMEYYSLLKGKGSERHGDTARKRLDRDISHAPLLSGDIIDMYASNPDSAHELVPQYGLLGCKEDEDPTLPSSQVFLNTNAPFSTFVCGVQGSGKSHTTACMIENAVVPSKTLGELKKPMSALVFSYGEWSNGGANFTLSEAISLATPAAGFPHLKAKKITVLVSPTNPAIKTLYERYDVQVIPFMLKPSSLDISALRALMAVDETSAVPLYMAKIESILRDIAMKSKDGVVDYSEFKKAVDKQGFDAHQENMLNMHLNLLETFLDQKGELPEPSYGAGEIVIIDLSDQFLTPSTACVLFKLGLEQFLKCSKVKGKLVVLDEAHKYMLDNPGSRFFTGLLDSTIRQQRHTGTRVLISTQEPTVSTMLISLCSVVIMHRFTSPSWYHTLKQDIHAVKDDDTIIMDIGNLSTGEAIIYAPTALIEIENDGSLKKSTRELIKLNMRDRVTKDGGESLMAI